MANKEIDYKARAERGMKIQSVYRDFQELKKLEAELDSAKAKYDTPEKSNAYRVKINSEIKKAKAKLKTNSDAIINSGDKELIKEYNDGLKDDTGKELTSALSTTSTKNKPMAEKKTTSYNFNDLIVASKKRDLTDGEKEYVNKYELRQGFKLRNNKSELENLNKEVKGLRNNVSYRRFKERWGKTKNRLIELEDVDLMNLSEDEISEHRKEVFDLEKYTKAVHTKMLENDGYKNKLSGFEEFELGFEKIGDFFEKIDAAAGDIYMGVNTKADDSDLGVDYDAMIDGLSEVGRKYQSSSQGIKPVNEEEVEGVENKTKQKEGGNVGLTGEKVKTTTNSNKPIEIENRDVKQKDADGKELGKEGVNWKARADEHKARLDELRAIQADEIDIGEYAPDSQSDSDVLGSLMDVGRTAVGMIGATKEIPEYERGSMWNKAMDSADRRSEEGLTADERNYRNQQSETAYAYNVKNIRKGAGGSSGAYLGNVQSAAAGLYGDYGKTAAIDEGLRRQNRANFQSMASKDEVINRQTFEDELSQAITSKRQGAALVGDAINNIKENEDYKKAYGKDSVFYQDKKATWKAKEYETELGKRAARNAESDAINNEEKEYNRAIQELTKQNQNSGANLGFNEDEINKNLETARINQVDDGMNNFNMESGSGLVDDITGTSPEKFEEFANNEEEIITDEPLPGSEGKDDLVKRTGEEQKLEELEKKIGEATDKDNNEFDPKKFTEGDDEEKAKETAKYDKMLEDAKKHDESLTLEESIAEFDAGIKQMEDIIKDPESSDSLVREFKSLLKMYKQSKKDRIKKGEN